MHAHASPAIAVDASEQSSRAPLSATRALWDDAATCRHDGKPSGTIALRYPAWSFSSRGPSIAFWVTNVGDVVASLDHTILQIRLEPLQVSSSIAARVFAILDTQCAD